MERKVITSMLPVWEIGSRIQAIMLTLAISVCAFIFMLWIEDIFENIERLSRWQTWEPKRKNNFCK